MLSLLKTNPKIPACRQNAARIFLLTDAPAGLSEFKNREEFVIVPIESWLKRELLEAGFSNIRGLEEWRAEEFEDYDALYRFYESAARRMSLEDDSLWRFLKQPLMQVIVPVCYVMDVLKNLSKEQNPLRIEARIVNPEYQFIFEEALKRLG
jgi:hypothetical protein